ncbi:hypothetical protein L3Q82_009718 [Scortum barcoo]|uniref:Uncharacterized protein n=1 Tax=Scortum barcoo TaxID=214431 RepID=A0ACB8WF01_9TELE|nr:hypothetical protein L3Q82_009718 [Scortum barcoo]
MDVATSLRPQLPPPLTSSTEKIGKVQEQLGGDDAMLTPPDVAMLLTMAAECTQQALLDFLREKGGKVRNADLIEHFKAVFPEEPEKKAAVRQSFKNYVDNIAYVRAESGERSQVCLPEEKVPAVRGGAAQADRERRDRAGPAAGPGASPSARRSSAGRR